MGNFVDKKLGFTPGNWSLSDPIERYRVDTSKNIREKLPDIFPQFIISSHIDEKDMEKKTIIGKDHYSGNWEGNAKLFASAKAMFYQLCMFQLMLEEYHFFVGDNFLDTIGFIEQISGKTWNEIKDIFNEELEYLKDGK